MKYNITYTAHVCAFFILFYVYLEDFLLFKVFLFCFDEEEVLLGV